MTNSFGQGALLSRAPVFLAFSFLGSQVVLHRCSGVQELSFPFLGVPPCGFLFVFNGHFVHTERTQTFGVAQRLRDLLRQAGRFFQDQRDFGDGLWLLQLLLHFFIFGRVCLLYRICQRSHLPLAQIGCCVQLFRTTEICTVVVCWCCQVRVSLRGDQLSTRNGYTITFFGGTVVSSKVS